MHQEIYIMYCLIHMNRIDFRFPSYLGVQSYLKSTAQGKKYVHIFNVAFSNDIQHGNKFDKNGPQNELVDVITQQSPLLNDNVIVGGENTLIIKRPTK